MRDVMAARLHVAWGNKPIVSEKACATPRLHMLVVPDSPIKKRFAAHKKTLVRPVMLFNADNLPNPVHHNVLTGASHFEMH